MKGMTSGDRLRAKLDLAYPALRASAERVWCSPSVRELYPVYLSTLHGIVRSAVPLLEAALRRARLLSADDAVAAAMVPYLARHAAEEAGHDRLLLADLAATGGDPQETLRRIPSVHVATLVGAQYYWLAHCHPVSLFGHMAAFEGYPPIGPRLVAKTRRRRLWQT